MHLAVITNTSKASHSVYIMQAIVPGLHVEVFQYEVNTTVATYIHTYIHTFIHVHIHTSTVVLQQILFVFPLPTV